MSYWPARQPYPGPHIALAAPCNIATQHPRKSSEAPFSLGVVGSNVHRVRTNAGPAAKERAAGDPWFPRRTSHATPLRPLVRDQSSFPPAARRPDEPHPAENNRPLGAPSGPAAALHMAFHDLEVQSRRLRPLILTLISGETDGAVWNMLLSKSAGSGDEAPPTPRFRHSFPPPWLLVGKSKKRW